MSSLTDRPANPEVRYVERPDGRGGGYEPGLPYSADGITQLRWKAATIEAECKGKVHVRVSAQRSVGGVPIPGHYNVLLYNAAGVWASTVGCGDFDDTWAFLNGIASGVEASMHKVADDVLP